MQLGLDKPKITGEFNAYCVPNGRKYESRVFKKLNLIAFSDPNDILSYPIPPNYAERYLDSRLCSNIINVDINVSEVKNVFGVEFANPGTAHSGYKSDDRVIGIVADGISRNQGNELVWPTEWRIFR